MTTTDSLKAAICKALEQRRAQLDAGLPLVSVNLVVQIDPNTKRLRKLIFRSEEADDLRVGRPS
jgi:mannitol-1-phosphate/altronate dehydrogenase